MMSSVMTSSAEDQLCLNIVSSLPSAPSARRRKPLSSEQRWTRKKQRAEKRRLQQQEEEQTEAPPPQRPQKQQQQRAEKRRRQQQQQQEEEEQTEAPPPQRPQAPPPEPPEGAAATPQKKKKKRAEREVKEVKEVKEAARSSIKTSSLFRHNPDIPELHRPAVTQVKEEIFTSDSFSGLQLHPHLVATLNKVLNVSTLTSVQRQTIPPSCQDETLWFALRPDQTLSYAVPLVQSLQAVQPRVRRSDGPLAVVIVPTRELALQTWSAFQKLLKPFTWIVPGVLMGGEKRKAEKARLRKGINILVSTPGRLVDHIQNTLSISFSSLRWLVLDEADRTLDLGFDKELSVILNSINAAAPSRQNVLLSATLTHGVTRLADVCLNDPVNVHVSGSASSDLTAVSAATSAPGPGGQSESFAVPEALRQFVVVVPSKIRLVCLAAFVLDKCRFSGDNKLIVFVSSCDVVEFLHSLFTAVLCRPSANQQPPLSFLRLHGNMKQEERSDVFQRFSAAASGVLLCTDVAARGLDLPQVTWILQFTPPTAAAEYVHRVGRTARIGGGGSSLLFLTPAETAFITELANHDISLSEMKLHDILSCLMRDDAYKGRGKYHSKRSAAALEQEVRERATVLQTEFENFVHSDAVTLQNAKKALQSFLRAYATYPANLKHIFHIRSLHLGHAAKSFGLRDAPQGLSAAKRPPGPAHPAAKRHDKTQTKRGGAGAREAGLLRSEFSSGLEGGGAKKKKKRKKKTIGQSGEEEEEEER